MDAIIIGPGSFYTSLMPPCLVRGVREAIEDIRGPVIYIANLLSEGSGMRAFTAAEGARRISEAIGRPVDVVLFNTASPNRDVLARYAVEHKHPLPLGEVDPRYRSDQRRLLDWRDRPPRSPASGLCRVGCARATTAELKRRRRGARRRGADEQKSRRAATNPATRGSRRSSRTGRACA